MKIVVEDVVMEAYEERRRYERYKSFLAALVNSQLVFIEDIGKGGMRILSTEPLGKVNDIITIDSYVPNRRLEHIVFNARIVWVREIEPEAGYVTGVEFKKEDKNFEDNIEELLTINNYVFMIKKREA